ncbi:MAG: type IV secretion system protein [Pseudomonadota bacterium]
MACPPIITGDQFLQRTLTHIDCQAQIIGSYGYQALGQPGSLASTLVLGLLTLFIAFFGIRLLFGPPPGARDVVYDVLKVGIVLTLAFSWPAFRTVVYDVTLNGPAEIVSVIQSSSGNQAGGDFATRLQRADDAMARLTQVGAGRNTGALLDPDGPGGDFRSAALEDDDAFGSARLLYLSSVIGSLAMLRIAAGLLLALAPIVAGLYFFTQSRGIFAGWLKGLVLTIAGSIGATLVLSVQLAIIEPWLADALRVRSLGYATPSAPTELFAITLAFALVQLVMLWFLGKIVFNRGWLTLPDFPRATKVDPNPYVRTAPIGDARQVEIVRAERVSNTIESSIRREQTFAGERLITNTQSASSPANTEPSYGSRPQRLGSTYRRSGNRSSRASQRRDGKS